MNKQTSITEDMICFSLYSAARATTQAYRKLLEPWSLTYPQYLVLAVLWNDGEQTISSLGAAMQLDSGTLSPLVRRLERAGLVTRTRDTDDERVVRVRLTDAGTALRADVSPIHVKIAEIAGVEDRHHHELIAELRTIAARLHEA